MYVNARLPVPFKFLCRGLNDISGMPVLYTIYYENVNMIFFFNIPFSFKIWISCAEVTRWQISNYWIYDRIINRHTKITEQYLWIKLSRGMSQEMLWLVIWCRILYINLLPYYVYWNWRNTSKLLMPNFPSFWSLLFLLICHLYWQTWMDL